MKKQKGKQVTGKNGKLLQTNLRTENRRERGLDLQTFFFYLTFIFN